MRNTYQQVSDAEIDQLERQLGFPVPHEYRRFLKEHNGGLPEQYLYVSDNDEIAVRFFGVNLAPDLDYDDVIAVKSRLGDLVPNGFVPIGADPGGNLVLLGTTDGQIFYLDVCSNYDAPEPRTLAPDIETFVTKFRRDPGEPGCPPD